MSEVVFIDTSVLVNLLDVPGKNANRDQITAEFLADQGRRTTFVLPVTTIIESGNHIAQLQGSGQVRRACADRLVKALKAALLAHPPWVLTGEVWDAAMVDAVIHGSEQRPAALELLTQGIGTGDIGILAEVEAYRRRVPSATPVRIWTLDHGLAAHA
jgi:hypothetical protein